MTGCTEADWAGSGSQGERCEGSGGFGYKHGVRTQLRVELSLKFVGNEVS